MYLQLENGGCPTIRVHLSVLILVLYLESAPPFCLIPVIRLPLTHLTAITVVPYTLFGIALSRFCISFSCARFITTFFDFRVCLPACAQIYVSYANEMFECGYNDSIT
ncbi:MAG: hypothetical protein J07HQW2_03714 [Haloquadratum walsbyi J07HQW2]|uniref:Uncharacterized protein n=1 Tax=Haloquadratum walsbyi J07HQW2 TaxID=1238425 RepID=U1NJU4_9EURY|nr:MAG: hypothetical protein J07HQW2_03714 [Haloquadratum walsbyi J07HQW2]